MTETEALLNQRSDLERTEDDWIQTTQYTRTRKVFENDKKKLQVISSREGAPFSSGHTSLLFLKHEEGVGLCVGSILDVDPKKGQRGGRQIPGGMLKNPLPGKEKQESFIDGACEEALAETGVFVSRGDLYPAATIVKSRFPGRLLSEDASSGEKTTITQKVFAHWGDVEFIETDDGDAKDPSWEPFSQIVESGKWFRSHALLVPAVVKIILANIERYEAGEITDPQDRRFYDKLMMKEFALKSAGASFQVLAYRKRLKEIRDSIDLLKIAYNLERGNYERAKGFLSRFVFFPLGSKEYFNDSEASASLGSVPECSEKNFADMDE